MSKNTSKIKMEEEILFRGRECFLKMVLIIIECADSYISYTKEVI